jgi:hypothetical protein
LPREPDDPEEPEPPERPLEPLRLPPPWPAVLWFFWFGLLSSFAMKVSF